MPSESLRKRWSHSVNAHLVPLPPAPTWKDLPQSVRTDYAMADAVAHRAAHLQLQGQIRSEGLRQVYAIDRAVLPWLARNEQIGLAVDRAQLVQLSQTFRAQFDAVCARINTLAGFRVNPLSGEQVADCLFTELGITPTRRTKGGKHFTTADKYLKARKHEHRIIPLILEARQLNKYLGTYTEKLPGLLQAHADGTWRYHPDWKYTRTPSGRLAEQIIVLIPKHDPLAKEQQRENRAKAIRNCFYATEGHQLVSVDLSQIELRVAAHLSRDRRLCEAYQRGEDLHAKVAHELLGAPKGRENQDDSKHRLPSKTMNFSVINGTTEYGVLDQLHEQGLLSWDLEQVREFLAAWFKLHDGFARHWERVKAEARARGCVRDLFGRIRWVTGIWSSNEQIQKAAEREALFAIQSSADGISKVWNKRIWRHSILPRHATGRRYIEPWVRVHDDTTLEVDARIARMVRSEMLASVPDLLRIPTTAEGKIGERWGSL